MNKVVRTNLRVCLGDMLCPCQDKARQDKTRQDKARQDKTRQEPCGDISYGKRVFIHNNHENGMETLLITEGQDLVYRESLSKMKGEQRAHKAASEIHPDLCAGLQLNPLPEVDSLCTGLGRSASLSACQTLLKEHLGLTPVDGDFRPFFVYKNESCEDFVTGFRIKWRLTNYTKSSPGHPNFHHSLIEPNLESWRDSHPINDVKSMYSLHPTGNIEAIPHFEFDNLLRRSGVLQASEEVYGASRTVLRRFIEGVSGVVRSEVVKYASNVVTSRSIQCGLIGGTLVHKVYGYGHPKLPHSLFSDGIYHVLKQVHPDLGISTEALAVVNDFVADLVVGILDMALAQYADNDRTDPDDDRTDTMTYQDKKRGMSHVVLESLHIREGVRWHLQGEFARHGISEGTKAVSKLPKGGLKQKSDGFKDACGLQFCVNGTVLAASRTHRGLVLTEKAAVYLTAVLEYMSAEVLELAGNAACGEKSIKVTPRHITLACREDEELNRLILKTAIRQELPLGLGTRHDMDSDEDEDLDSNLNSDEPVTLSKNGRDFCLDKYDPKRPFPPNVHCAEYRFIEVFIDMLEASAEHVLIDPRDGLHKRLLPLRGDDRCSSPFFEGRIAWVPELDALCSLKQAERQVKALEDLNSRQRLALERFYRDDGQLQSKRLGDIRMALFGTGYSIDPVIFRRVVRESSDAMFWKGVVCTEEAYDCLQCAAEEHMSQLYQLAHLNAVHAGRDCLNVSDLELVSGDLFSHFSDDVSKEKEVLICSLSPTPSQHA
jgi:histone H2A